MLLSIFGNFANDAALIVSCTFFIIWLSYYLKRKNATLSLWVSSILYGFVSVIVMQDPFVANGSIFDLRSIAIFFASYIGGLPGMFLSVILPSLYRFYLGGGTLFLGLILSIFLPAVVGYVMGRIKLTSTETNFNITEILLAYMVFTVGNMLGIVLFMDIPTYIWIEIKVTTIILSAATIIPITIMINAMLKLRRRKRI